MSVVPRPVQNAKYNNCVFFENEEDAVGKPTSQHATNFRLASQTSILAGIGNGTINGRANFSKKLLAKPLLLTFVPEGSVRNVGFSLGADDEPAGH